LIQPCALVFGIFRVRTTLRKFPFLFVHDPLWGVRNRWCQGGSPKKVAQKVGSVSESHLKFNLGSNLRSKTWVRTLFRGCWPLWGVQIVVFPLCLAHLGSKVVVFPHVRPCTSMLGSHLRFKPGFHLKSKLGSVSASHLGLKPGCNLRSTLGSVSESHNLRSTLGSIPSFPVVGPFGGPDRRVPLCLALLGSEVVFFSPYASLGSRRASRLAPDTSF
jgi:hypothetical protein